MKLGILAILALMFANVALAETGESPTKGPRLTLSPTVKKLVDEGKAQFGRNANGEWTIIAPKNLLHCELTRLTGSHAKTLICLTKEEYRQLTSHNKRLLQHLSGLAYPK